MPQAVGFVVVGLKIIGLSGALAGLLAGTIVSLGVSIGLNLLTSALFGPKSPKPSDGQQSVRAAIGPRKRHYGIVHTSGQETFFESRDGTLAYVLTLGTGEEDGTILEHRLNDKTVTVNGSGDVTSGGYGGNVHIYTRRGTDDQTAIGELTAEFPEWTANHRQRGCAHTAVICDPVEQEDFAKVYNNRVPAYTQVRQAARVYDPRADDTAVIGFDGAGDPIHGTGAQRVDDRATWAWSDNWALVTADFAAHADGFGLGYDNINWANIAAEATICDGAVTPQGGGSIARWRIWGSYDLLNSARKDTLEAMLRAGDGFCWQDENGLFNLQCGRWIEPAIVITDDHILSVAATTGPEARDQASALKMLYTEAANGYREEESALVPVPGATEGPNARPAAVELFFAPHHNQAVRVGKRLAAALDPDRWQLQLQLNLFGLNLVGQRFPRVESALLGVSGWFEVSGAPELGIAEGQMAVSAALSEVDPADWDFDGAEEGTPPASEGSSNGSVIITGPEGLELSAVPIMFGESYGVAIRASWGSGRAGLEAEVQYRPLGGGADWITLGIESESRTAVSGPVDSGVTYEVRIRYLTIGGFPSAWSESATITPIAAASLGAPTSLFAAGGTGEADISFSMPTSSTLDHAKVYASSTADFGFATQVGADVLGVPGGLVSVNESGLSAGTRYYWAKAFDGVGGQSALAGPVMATIE